MKSALSAFSILANVFIPSAFSAPCCAGSGALPSVITGDEAMLFSASYGYGKVIADAPASGTPIFRDSLSPHEVHQNITFNFATLLDRDRLQAGLSIPIIMNGIETQKRSEKNAGLSDVSATIGYELVPELEYSLWKPRVFGFFQTVFPTGKSIYDSTEALGTDVRGLGFWQTQAGVAIVKRWSDWDSTVVFKAGRIFGKSNDLQDIDGFWAFKASLGAGYSFAERFRVGLSLDPNYQTAVTTRDQNASAIQTESKSEEKWVWDTIASFTVLIGQEESLALSYVDQTIMGPASNTSLSRSAVLAWTHRWER